METEYIKNSDGEDVLLTLTSIDLQLFFDHYDVYNVEWISGYKFMASDNLFKEYIDYWASVKIQATHEHNSGMRTIAKLMLNTLYGKFGTNPYVTSRYPVLIDGEVKYKLTEKEERKALYIPVATFITAHARNKTIRSAQACFDRFIYADTDSLHIRGDSDIDIDVDDVEIGKWKYEFKFDRARYIRAKCYIEHGHDPIKDEEDYLKVTVSGMPYNCHGMVTFENFKPGASYDGKLLATRVEGGTVLSETCFTIRK